MHHRLEISSLSHDQDARGRHILQQIRDVLGLPAVGVRVRDVYSIHADIDMDEGRRIMEEIINPITQRGLLGNSEHDEFDWLIIVAFLPGVTDNVGRTAGQAIADILARPLKDSEHLYSSIEYLIFGPNLDHNQVESIAYGLLANPLIHEVTILSRLDWQLNGLPMNKPTVSDSIEIGVDMIDVNIGESELKELSFQRGLALSVVEMQAIKSYFNKHAGDPARTEMGLSGIPTDVEIEVLAQTWSEHCKHKIFAARIEYTNGQDETREINSLFDSCIRRSTRELSETVDYLVSVFTDNAGIIALTDDVHLVYKVETHNTPSALDPYGGAMTGIVGVNRDPLGTGIGANLFVNVWGYCFGSPFTDPDDVPNGLLHPRRIRDEVHRGVIDGGNQSGIPYGLGWEFFDDRYIGKPLVFCGTLGLLPATINGKPSHEKSIKPGDFVVMAGGRIGKDGIHGATFSSEELHHRSPAHAVQIGDPITQKNLYDFIIEARDKGWYRFITDNGAGGLSSSIGEMSTNCNGCEFDLEKAPLKYHGLQPWEILLSEAQERMSLAVPPENLQAFVTLAKKRNVEVTVLGTFTDTGKFHVRYGDQTVAYMDLDFMHDGCPQMQLKAHWDPPVHEEPELPVDEDLDDILLAMLRALNVCSGEAKARQYDHEVKGLSVVKPYIGVGNDVQSDAGVFAIAPCAMEGVVLASAVLPRYSDIDTYHMTASCIDLAIRRIIAVGGSFNCIACLDNFCWPDPVESVKTPDGQHKLAQLVRANDALYDYTKAFRMPLISGKDSMKNDSVRGGRKISVPPTLLISAVAFMPDISKAQDLGIKRSGDLVYVLGQTKKELGGSEIFAQFGYIGNDVPRVDAESSMALYAAVIKATELELCHSLHAPALGGLGIGFARKAMAGRLGIEIDLVNVPADPDLLLEELLFSESNSRFIATISPHSREEFESLFSDLPCKCVGVVKLEPALTFFHDGQFECELAVSEMLEAYRQTLNQP